MNKLLNKPYTLRQFIVVEQDDIIETKRKPTS